MEKTDYVTTEYYNEQTKSIEMRIEQVEGKVVEVKDEFRALQLSMARTEGYQEASLKVLEDIKENTKDITQMKVDQAQMKTEVNNVLSEFEKVKETTRGKSRDNKEILIKLIWLVGTLGAAALGASWLF